MGAAVDSPQHPRRTRRTDPVRAPDCRSAVGQIPGLQASCEVSRFGMSKEVRSGFLRVRAREPLAA